MANFTWIDDHEITQEIDTPGHTAIISESHPEHVACAQASPWADFANGKFSSLALSLMH